MNLVELEPADTQAVDWSVLSEPHIDSVAQAVARSISRDYGLTLEFDDAHQEALLVMAERGAQVRSILADAGPGLLNRWLSQRLRDRWLTEARRRAGHTSYEAARLTAERAER
ncbi:hypothetical protein [Kitasatospora sp. NBC_01302]|uniref:hypothetical protein n=1 Tax=Kitasatospora sp. NBC_01302 TaxID=2903575 RepID=UPI002E0F9DE5|nr:hypothetical protein OG294_24510 [Kitasatospora sp. NBC_01302]